MSISADNDCSKFLRFEDAVMCFGVVIARRGYPHDNTICLTPHIAGDCIYLLFRALMVLSFRASLSVSHVN